MLVCLVAPLFFGNFGKNQRSKPRETEMKVKEELLKSIVKIHQINDVKLNETVERVTKYKDAVSIVKHYERLQKMQKQNIICLDYRQKCLFEGVKESSKFINMV